MCESVCGTRSASSHFPRFGFLSCCPLQQPVPVERLDWGRVLGGGGPKGHIDPGFLSHTFATSARCIAGPQVKYNEVYKLLPLHERTMDRTFVRHSEWRENDGTGLGYGTPSRCESGMWGVEPGRACGGWGTKEVLACGCLHGACDAVDHVLFVPCVDYGTPVSGRPSP